ncbi:MAG TPA: NAD(P)H-quinone dehydrogenase [Acidothermaceae bacterium]|nr:NAD(P)H-quinone dehydrogenase [Acidothermaceae bacterium]
MTRIAIIGGGPGGYEAALVAAQLGAEVTVIERTGVGGACVLTDCVPSKTLIATAEAMTALALSPRLGVRFDGGTDHDAGNITVDAEQVNARVRSLAKAQSDDIATRLATENVRVIAGSARLAAPTVAGHRVTVSAAGAIEELDADVVLLATGAHPRIMPTAMPDGERILTWHQIYDLDEFPEHLIVVGSGVTGAEFAGAYQALGSQVTLVSSRDRVLPGEDADAAAVVEAVFRRRGMTVVSNARALAVKRTAGGVVVELADGTTVEGTHCLMAVGSVPNTTDMGLEEAGVRLSASGYVEVDRVSRTSTPGIYAAGDCTGVLMLASVAAMQGRIAMWHSLGEAVRPLRLSMVAANVFTDPEIAAVGVSQATVDAGSVEVRSVKLPLARNARAKMAGVTDGFVKLFARPGTGVVLGGVVVAPKASELILPVTMGVQLGLTVDQIAQTFSVYPSLSGSITEAGRQLMETHLD